MKIDHEDRWGNFYGIRDDGLYLYLKGETRRRLLWRFKKGEISKKVNRKQLWKKIYIGFSIMSLKILRDEMKVEHIYIEAPGKFFKLRINSLLAAEGYYYHFLNKNQEKQKFISLRNLEHLEKLDNQIDLVL